MKNRIPKLFFLLCLLLCIIIPSTCKKVEKEMLVSTGSISNISANSAKISGEVIDIGAGATQYGHCYATTPNPTTANLKTQLGIPADTGVFISQLANLQAETKYYVKAYLSDANHTVYGKETDFTTIALCTAPSATTNAATSISNTTATLNGTVNANNSSTTVTFDYGTTTSYGSSITATQSPVTGSSSTAVSAGVTSLVSNTLYHYRVKTVNCGGTIYGADQQFITLCSAPAATTNAATSVSNTTATLNGTVNANNSSTTVTFDYGTTTSYGSSITATQSPVTGSSSTAVSAAVTGFVSNTLYHYRVKTVSCGGTIYGSDQQFTTTAVLTVTDYDGNVYNTVTIGTQIWMASNLKTTKYNDGTTIPLVTDNGTWAGLTTPAYCWYNNDATTNEATYGALYNWYAINTGKLCPTGWHVSTDAEWTTLSTYLGGESTAGGALKETGTTHWSSPNTGATNSTGFTGVPGGSRMNNGTFVNIGTMDQIWTATETSASVAAFRFLYYSNASVNWSSNYEQMGLSVRCVKD
jgi:uncharacterized protein (TIGR02145 family)